MKTLCVEFEELHSGPGVLDIAIRFDSNTGSFEYALEENGLPTSVSAHELAGILAIVQAHVTGRLAKR